MSTTRGSTTYCEVTMRARLPSSIAAAALLLATAAGTPSAATAAPPVPSKAWTADDILLAESAGSFAISPDGQRAVWVKSRMDEEKGKGVLAGGSADLPAGTVGPSTSAGEAYRGFRVVKGEPPKKAE